ncbi:MAG: DUF2933 domain-containing protein [Rhodoferax sp.]|nr:DUF2933 domain-containing protein [Rhodoferax sp.]
MNHVHSRHDTEPKAFWGSRSSIGLVLLGGIALYFLLTEHRAHFFGALPFLLLLACPLMHVFMHGGHGGHGGGEGHQKGGQQSPDDAAPKQPLKTREQP